MVDASVVMERALSLDEGRRLADCEAVIERGLNTFVDVGNALAAIRDEQLYRNTHGTFENYCRDRWGMERAHAYRLMDAATVVGNVSNWRQIETPRTESQARPLARLAPDEQIAAWQQAVETAPNGKVTAAHVETVVNEFRPRVVVREEFSARPPEPPNKLAIHFSSETPEHYTPTHVIERVAACLGGIDLDPCADARHHVPAAKHYVKEDDGLTAPWAGRVYMNPPYGREIELWVNRLCLEHERGNVTEAIALLPARVDTQWWKRMRNYVVCFVEGRLTFIGNQDPAPFPSALVYFGNDIGKFYDHFVTMGDIWQRLERGMFGE